jgi:hypothetical protein
MRIRFVPDASAADRDAVAAAAARRGLACDVVRQELSLTGRLRDDDAVALAAMQGVAEVVDPHATRREVALLWLAGACATLGGLAIVAANLPARLGTPADPTRAPEPGGTAWPLLPWRAAMEQVPSWVPVPFLLALAAAALFAWPSLGRRLAERRPVLHAALGAAVLLLVAGLAAWELAR